MLFTIRIESVHGLEKNSEIIVHKDFVRTILDMFENSADVKSYSLWNAVGECQNYFIFGFVNIPSKWKLKGAILISGIYA
jgi:hypothetical protein